MVDLSHYIQEFPGDFKELPARQPWELLADIQLLITRKLTLLPADFIIHGNRAIHKTAVVEEHVVLKGPLIVSENCFIAAHSYLRNGVYLGNGVSLGPGCEVKSSFIFSRSALAHFNFVGDSWVGSNVNLEAGAVFANHYNERASREIEVVVNGQRIRTGSEKFGAVVGDYCRIGANAVLSPGTVLPPKSIVHRLQLIDQHGLGN